MDKVNKKILACAYACIGAPDKRFISTEGGEGVLGWNVVSQLNRFCHVSVLTHKQNEILISKRLEKYPLENVDFYYLDLPGYLEWMLNFHGGVQLYAYFWQIRAYFFAKKLHAEKKFDLFHHVTFANDWMASFIGALLPILFIRGPGGGAQRVPKAFLHYFSFAERAKEALRTAGQIVFRADPFFIAGRNRAKVLLVCNNESCKILPKKYKNVYFFPVNGLSKPDLAKFSEAVAKKDTFSVITAGRLIKIKAFDLAIRAFAKFSKEAPNSKFTIIGEGPELDALKRLAIELGVENSVVFVPWLERSSLFKEMLSSDVFIFPSLRDGGGNVVVEAMAAGLPVICFDLAGPGLHVDDSCGFKIKAETPRQSVQEMAQALKKIYANPKLKQELGSAAKQKAFKKYDWDSLGNQLNEIYGKVLQ